MLIIKQTFKDIRTSKNFSMRAFYHNEFTAKRKCVAAQQHAQNIINLLSA
jgi:hypothetical protein